MIKGEKIRLKKPMGAFKNIGEICEVTDVADGGIICFKFGGIHLGCMTFDEYEKYFEKVEEHLARTWTNWEKKKIAFHDLNDNVKNVAIRYRNNGKKTQVRCGSIKSESSCYKEDIFNAEKGLELAIKRFIAKYLDKQIQVIAKTM